MIQNPTFDPTTFARAANAEANRLHFTFDSACRKGHHQLTPPGLPVGAANSPPQYPNLGGKKEIVIKRGMPAEAAKYIECHAKKTPGVVEAWKEGKMGHAGIGCYDCHVVEKSSPMASQCTGVKGTNTYISPMVSSKTCARCHPAEVEPFLKSGHALLAGAPVIEKEKFQKLMYYHEGAEFMGNKKGSPSNRATRASGCQTCHGTKIELGPDHKPINETWPGTSAPAIPTAASATARSAIPATVSRWPKPASPRHAAPVTWVPTIRTWKSISKASTASST